MNRRSVLVTGASRGLGLVVADALDSDYEVQRFSSKDFDFRRPQDWNCVVPRCNIVIHCAGGGLGLRGPLIPAEAMHDLFMVNLGGALEINRMLLPYMQADGWGRIVHILSIASGEALGSVGYNTVKAALAGYVRSAGREFARDGVVVVGVAPGAFIAPENAMARLQGNAPDAYKDFLNNRLPRGVMGRAEELLPLIRLLISDDASMMAGTIIPVDAGEGRYYSMP